MSIYCDRKQKQGMRVKSRRPSLVYNTRHKINGRTYYRERFLMYPRLARINSTKRCIIGRNYPFMKTSIETIKNRQRFAWSNYGFFSEYSRRVLLAHIKNKFIAEMSKFICTTTQPLISYGMVKSICSRVSFECGIAFSHINRLMNQTWSYSRPILLIKAVKNPDDAASRVFSLVFDSSQFK